jgi:hypothetical protein
MRFATVRLISIGMALTLFGLAAAFAQGPDAKTHAREILDQTRAALGGDAALNAVRSLSGSGDFRNGSGGAEVSGEFQLELMLPDKLMRTMKWSPSQAAKVTNVEALNGDQVWTDSHMKQPQQILGDGPVTIGGMGRGSGRSGGGMGRGGGGRRSTGSSGGNGKQPGIHGPAPELGAGTDNQQIHADYACLIMVLLLHSPDLSQAEFIHTSDDDINGAKADLLKIVAGNGLEISLAIDQKTHRPITASYKLSMTDAKAGQLQDPDKAEKETATGSGITEVQIYFSEYKAVTEKGLGDIWLPYQISKTRNGQTVEDMHIKKFQLNPNLKSKQFEKKG